MGNDARQGLPANVEPCGSLRSDSAAMLVVLVLLIGVTIGCERADQPPPASTSATQPQQVPQSLEMGGAKSVMTFFVTRRGLGDGVNSWNSVHAARGCSQSDLQATGGAGLFYCFGVD